MEKKTLGSQRSDLRHEIAKHVTTQRHTQIIQTYRLLLVTDQLTKDLHSSMYEAGSKGPVNQETVREMVNTFFNIGTSKAISSDELEANVIEGNIAMRGGAAMNSRVNEKLTPAVVSMLRADQRDSVLIGRIFNEEEGEVYGELDALSQHGNPNVKAAVALCYLLKRDRRDGIILKRLSDPKQEELVRKCASLSPFRNSDVQKFQAQDCSLRVLYGGAINSTSLPSTIDAITARIYGEIGQHWQVGLDTTVGEQIKRIKLVLPYHHALTERSKQMLANDQDREVREQVEAADRMYENASVNVPSDAHRGVNGVLSHLISLFRSRRTAS